MALALHSPIRHTKLFKAISNILTDFLSLEEAVAIENNVRVTELVLPPVPLWRRLSLAVPALLETIAWLALSSYRLVVFDFHESHATYDLWAPFLVAISWFYASVKPVMRPSPTPPYDLFILYLVHAFMALLSVGSAIYRHYINGEIVSKAYVFGTGIHFIILGGLLSIVFSMPLGVPTARVDKEEIGKTISPEDYTTLFEWATFSWVYPLIKKVTFRFRGCATYFLFSLGNDDSPERERCLGFVPVPFLPSPIHQVLCIRRTPSPFAFQATTCLDPTQGALARPNSRFQSHNPLNLLQLCQSLLPQAYPRCSLTSCCRT